MAYKSKKKNKVHVRNLRKAEGNIRKKHEREKKRNHPEQEMTLAYLEQKMREQGLI